MTRTIIINPVLNGYLCQVGCQQVVFQNRVQMLKELDIYLQKPEETEKRYFKNAVNEMPERPMATACGTMAPAPVAPIRDIPAPRTGRS